MKKIVCILSLSALLVGCSSSSSEYTTSLSDGKNAIVTGEGISVTKDDIYKTLLKQYGPSQVVNMALQYIADKEITDQEAIDKKLQETIDQYAQYMENGIDQYAVDQGYKDKQDYIDQVLMPSVKSDLLKSKYVNDKFDDLLKEYKVKYLKVLIVASESEALEIIEKSKDEETFNTILTEKSGNDYGMITNENTSIDSAIIAKLDKFTKDGIYSKAIKTSDDKYAIVYVYNSDTKSKKDEIISNLSSLSSLTTKCQTYYLQNYKFSVYEDPIKDIIEETNEEYLEG